MTSTLTLTTPESIRDFFTYHPPDTEQRAVLEELRADYTALALRLHEKLPAGPGKTVAIRALGDAMMKSNRCIMTRGK